MQHELVEVRNREVVGRIPVEASLCSR
jgi:hypothetical protein